MDIGPSPVGPLPVAVLVSGSGSNMVALVQAADDLGVRIVSVLSDVADAPALARAEQLGVPTVRVPFDRTDRLGWERRLADAIAATGAELVVLAGFMRILGADLLRRWPDRVVNVHPSLLPAFRGAHAVEEALAAGVKVTGVTVHLVDELVDHGPILAQEAVPVHPDDTAGTLHARLQEVEHRLLPSCVAAFADGRVTVRDGRATIDAQLKPRPTRSTTDGPRWSEP
jgi:phosphoribosylglycinamide formyltransferase 1